jgi:hypothetical protein
VCACYRQMLVSVVGLVAAECRACGRLVYGIDPRIDLSSCISANHVFKHKLAARMPLCPAIVEAQYIVLEDDDGLASSDEVLDLPPRVYAGVGHGGYDQRCLDSKTRRKQGSRISSRTTESERPWRASCHSREATYLHSCYSTSRGGAAFSIKLAAPERAETPGAACKRRLRRQIASGSSDLPR